LRLRFIPAEANLVAVDCRTGEQLLAPEEAYQSLQEAKEKAAEVESALEQERRKNADLAAELKRLKGKKK
jgi:hypothetical protein